jgi:DUF971 family protein
MLRILEMKVESATTFSILWQDGQWRLYVLSHLQRICPCSACRDPKTGVYRKNPDMIPEDLPALSLATVGNYALKIEFASGCSFGIYTFELLKNLGRSFKGSI